MSGEVKPTPQLTEGVEEGKLDYLIKTVAEREFTEESENAPEEIEKMGVDGYLVVRAERPEGTEVGNVSTYAELYEKLKEKKLVEEVIKSERDPVLVTRGKMIVVNREMLEYLSDFEKKRKKIAEELEEKVKEWEEREKQRIESLTQVGEKSIKINRNEEGYIKGAVKWRKEEIRDENGKVIGEKIVTGKKWREELKEMRKNAGEVEKIQEAEGNLQRLMNYRGMFNIGKLPLHAAQKIDEMIKSYLQGSGKVLLVKHVYRERKGGLLRWLGRGKGEYELEKTEVYEVESDYIDISADGKIGVSREKIEEVKEKGKEKMKEVEKKVEEYRERAEKYLEEIEKLKEVKLGEYKKSKDEVEKIVKKMKKGAEGVKELKEVDLGELDEKVKNLKKVYSFLEDIEKTNEEKAIYRIMTVKNNSFYHIVIPRNVEFY